MEYAIVTHEGKREHNEDAVAGKIRKINEIEYGCFVMADGLGGHGRGEVASQLVVETLMEDFEKRAEFDGVLEWGFEKAQEEIMKLQEKERAFHEMKTTAVALYADKNSIYWAHIGDSRLYYFKNKKLIERTRDHSVPQMLCSAGDIKEKEIRKHPDRNKLLRVMGIAWDKPKYVVSKVIQNVGNQAFLLCSDGFWENIDEKKMQKCLKKAKDVQDWLEQMDKIVQKNGMNTDMDNNTAIAVFI